MQVEERELAGSDLCSSPSVVLIARLARAARHLFDGALAPLGLRQRHLVALTYLRDHGATPQQSLAAALRVDPSNLVGLLNELEEKELALRRHAEGDRRRHVVEITARGEKVLDEEMARSLEAVEAALLGSLDGEERETLRRLLARAAAGAAGDGETPC